MIFKHCDILFKSVNFCAKKGHHWLWKIRKSISFWRWMMQCCKMRFFLWFLNTVTFFLNLWIFAPKMDKMDFWKSENLFKSKKNYIFGFSKIYIAHAKIQTLQTISQWFKNTQKVSFYNVASINLKKKIFFRISKSVFCSFLARKFKHCKQYHRGSKLLKSKIVFLVALPFFMVSMLRKTLKTARN